ncbi:MAG: hypothetical protein ACOCVG_03955 [Verrucomicrobiota bacterium]
MLNFADQCLDLARSILGQNLESINEDGTIAPLDGEESRLDEPGHAALAIGEYYRATQKNQLEGIDLIDLSARTITAQIFTEEESENGLAYAALGLLSFGPAKDRNPVWERLLDPTRETMDRRLLARTDYDDHNQAFNIAKSVTRYSLGLSKKDETGKLLDRFIERIESNSSQNFVDDAPNAEGRGRLGGAYDIYGVLSHVLIRQALQLHANINLRERKLPTLRNYFDRYLKMLPDLVRQDGLGWSYGKAIGVYGQMHCISLLLQSMRDGWIDAAKRPQYQDILRRLFSYFFISYLDQERGYLDIRDAERDTIPRHTTRMANFDAARYLCQWSRLARAIGGSSEAQAAPPKKVSRFIVFDKSSRKEQGLFLYSDPGSGLHVQLPLISAGGELASTPLAFPHCPGVFDFPANTYLPILLPELTFQGKATVPAFYGRRCTTSLGAQKAVVFSYEQPELITTEEKFLNGVGSVKVSWSFIGNKITSEFIYTVKNQVKLEKLRYVMAIGTPHSHFRPGNALALGAEGLRASVVRDDFQAQWEETDVVTNDPAYRGYWGNIHYLQTLSREHPLVMRPGQQYRLTVSFEPDITTVE